MDYTADGFGDIIKFISSDYKDPVGNIFSVSSNDGMLTFSCGMIVTLALAVVALLIGNAILNRVKFLQKYCIPSPVIGGFLFMIIIFIGKYTGIFNLQFVPTENATPPFQTVFMVAFFTTVGLSADFRLLKQGGRLLLIYWLLAGIISAAQGPIAMILGDLMGLDKAYSITAGAISMCGGHGAGAAYGATIVERGWEAAKTCALACATLGLICSVMLGGPLSRRLITKNNLKPPEMPKRQSSASPKTREERRSSAMDIMKNFAVIVICMAVGVLIAKFASLGLSILLGGSQITLPDYIGAMFISVLVRNMNEKFHWFNYNAKFCDGLGGITLDVFLSIAMMSIDLFQLIELGPRLAVLVLVQVVIMAFYVYFIVFRALGKNYDAAVMCGGMCGHALGATPTAMANMEAVTSKFGFSQTAFVIVPIVGAFLVDLVYQPVTIVLINTLIPVVN